MFDTTSIFDFLLFQIFQAQTNSCDIFFNQVNLALNTLNSIFSTDETERIIKSFCLKNVILNIRKGIEGNINPLLIPLTEGNLTLTNQMKIFYSFDFFIDRKVKQVIFTLFQGIQ